MVPKPQAGSRSTVAEDDEEDEEEEEEELAGARCDFGWPPDASSVSEGDAAGK